MFAYAVHDKWEDELMFSADGTFSRKTIKSFNSGTYILSENYMCLLWDNWEKEELYSMDSKLYMNRTFVVNLSKTNGSYKDFFASSGKLIVERQHENQSVCLVGNACLNIGLCKGKAIDKCDILVRFNGFSLDESLCADLGKKTNVVFITPEFVHKIKLFIGEAQYLIFNPLNHLVISKEHEQFIITRSFNYYVLSKYYLNEKTKSRPSTGFFAILYYLFYLNYQHIYITNFDFQLCTDRPIEYFNNDAKPSQCHDFKYEKEVVLDLIREGYITVI
jgi:hypothetical protein